MTVEDPFRVPHVGQLTGARAAAGAIARGAVPCRIIGGTGA